MIDRDQVLHVARLARLELSEEEIERMAGELSGILEHVDRDRGARPRRRRADLARGRARERAAPRRARAEPAARARARERARPGRRRLPRPLARRRDASCSSSARPRRSAGSRRASCPPDEYFDAYAEAAAGDDLNAYLWRAEPGGRGAGGEPLRGVPVAVKDLFCTEGIETTAGSRILEGYRPPYTATAVRRLADAGARLLGKTNMDEFAMGSSNENSGYGPVRNPWDHGRVPGGSSGGSAAAVAGRLAPWAIGTDTGGSIRQPASLCGIVGLKPTYGAISRYGMIAFASSLDQCGPLTRDVTDAALLLAVMQGRDPHDSTSVGIEGGVALPSRDDLAGLRFGVARDFSHHAEGVEPGVADVFERALATIESLGGRARRDRAAERRARDLRLLRDRAGRGVVEPAALRRRPLRAARARRRRARPRCTSAPGPRGFGDEVKRRIMLGTYALSSGYYEAYYGRAQKVRTRIADDFRARVRARAT